MTPQLLTIFFPALGVLVVGLSVILLAKASYRNGLDEAEQKLIKTLKAQVEEDGKQLEDLQRQNNQQSAVILYLQEQIDDVAGRHHHRLNTLESSIPPDLAVWLRSISRKLDNTTTTNTAQVSAILPENE